MKTSDGESTPRFLFYSFVHGVRLVFNLARMVQPRFRKAIASFEAVYQFRSGPAAARLVFADGRVRIRHGESASPDCEINFIDLRGALAHLLKKPNDGLSMMLENKISQSGNAYYFLKFGYLCGLIERGIRGLSARKRFFGRPSAKEIIQ